MKNIFFREYAYMISMHVQIFRKKTHFILGYKKENDLIVYRTEICIIC
jgi:hypothetical protein